VMTRLKQQFNSHVNAYLWDGARPPTAFAMMPFAVDPVLMDGLSPNGSLRWKAEGHRRLSSPPAGLKPMSDETRRMPPFGSPGREGQTRRSTGGVASSQVDPPQGGTGARVQRHRRWRGHSPLRLPECMADPASLGSVPPPTALREVRLNGLPEALAEVLRHRTGGGRRVADAVPTGFSDARFVAKPAYPLGPHSVSPLRRLAGGCAPSDPRTGNGAP